MAIPVKFKDNMLYGVGDIMDDWRNDVALIREMLSGEPSSGWRNDAREIAQVKGHNATGWREAIRLISQGYEIPHLGWRNDISAIAQKLTGSAPLPWRSAIKSIRQYVEGNSPAPTGILFFLNTLPRQPNMHYVILINGIIEADKIILT